ncbi:MAG: aminopeptidase P family protein [Thermodesulfobacteriota bacterium]|nr:aminopeptidase P family protein [Thermodesulfobacteriota bacterium]
MRERACQKIKERLDSYSLDAILISSLDNIRYISGFTGSEGIIMFCRDQSYFLTDSRYTTQAAEQTSGFIVQQYRKKESEISELIIRLCFKNVGFEPKHITFEAYNKLSENLQDTRLIPIPKGLESIRSKKEEAEVESIKEAIRIASESYLQAIKKIEFGIEEREVALEIEYLIKRRGGQGIPFDIIVASGKRAALPHGVSSNKRIEKGDLVLIDFGARYQGYCSDETQTLVVGKPTHEQKKIHQIVRDSQQKAFEAIKPGVDVTKVDIAARDYIEKAGFGKYFGHGTGHGVGLAVHEMPHISPLSEGIIEEGMVFTIEPGIYIPRWGGVRLEDMIRVTSFGCERLTYLSKDLYIA